MHIKASRLECRELFFACVRMMANLWFPRMISSSLLLYFLFSFYPSPFLCLLRGSLMRTHKTGPLLPALPLSITELFWRLCLCLIFQPHMLALFHLSLPSPSLACDCRDGRNIPRRRPLEEAGLSARVVLVTLTLTDARRISGVFLQQSGLIRFTDASGQTLQCCATCHRL